MGENVAKKVVMGYNKGMAKDNTKNNAGAGLVPQTMAGEILHHLSDAWRRILWLTAFLIPFVYVMALSINELVEILPILQDYWSASEMYGMTGGIEVAAIFLISLVVFMVLTIFITIFVVMLKIIRQLLLLDKERKQ